MTNIMKFSPLTEASYYTLLSLVSPLHGYGIMKKVQEMSLGRVTLAAGTLYGVLNTLLENQLIILISEDENNKRRKLYQMTDQGKLLMSYEMKRLKEMLENGDKEMGDI